METFLKLVATSGFANVSFGNLVMFLVAGALICLAVARRYEPLLLIPIGFGIGLANLPLGEMGAYVDGMMRFVYLAGIETRLLPLIVFLGIGALTDFRPLLARPLTFLLGAAAPLGIFAAALGAAHVFGFTPKEAASIGMIGAADGPLSIFLAVKLAPHLLGPIALAAYGCLSLATLIQPPIVRMLTTEKERGIDMPQPRTVSRAAAVAFPLITGILASLSIPSCAPLIGMLMFGNLLRESGVTQRLRDTAGSALIDIVTIFLGVAVGSALDSERFLTFTTLWILIAGVFAFALGTAGGVIFGKILNLFLPPGRQINPCMGAVGVSVPAPGGQTFASEGILGGGNPPVQALGHNVAGMIGSALAAGVFFSLLS